MTKRTENKPTDEQFIHSIAEWIKQHHPAGCELWPDTDVQPRFARAEKLDRRWFRNPRFHFPD